MRPISIAGTTAGIMLASTVAPAGQPKRLPVAANSRTTALDAYVGRWQIVPALTYMGRNGPAGDNILRSQTFTFVFARAGAGLMMDVYAAWPQAKPSHSMPLHADGRTDTCPDPVSCMTKGDSKAAEQTYVWHMPDPHLLVRLFYLKGQPYDYSTVSLSTDGRTMTLISWDPATPQYQNIQVLTKQ